MHVFTWHEPIAAAVPIVLSVPHAGTFFPDEIRDQFDPRQLARLDDTDWFVDRLYSFASAIGIPVLRANYHRWVIDLNRSPSQQPLYTDGRLITGLCPTTDFLGHPIYCDQRTHLEPGEIESRKRRYFDPYHTALLERLEAVRKHAGVVLLWDCHSIRKHVPTIQSTPFPDFILGSAGGASASQDLVETALRALQQSGCGTALNFPFQGGFITRTHGRPAAGFHALQLEMSKTNYMDDTETQYHDLRAAKTAGALQSTLLRLTETLLAHPRFNG